MLVGVGISVVLVASRRPGIDAYQAGPGLFGGARNLEPTGPGERRSHDVDHALTRRPATQPAPRPDPGSDRHRPRRPLRLARARRAHPGALLPERAEREVEPCLPAPH